MSRWYFLGIDLGASLGVAKVYTDGTLHAQTFKLKTDMGSRVVGVRRIINSFVAEEPDCLGIAIEEPFGAHKAALRQLYAMLGSAVLTCEQLSMPYAVLHLSVVKKHATGRGNAKKPEMQAAALARWGQELSEDSADAAWVAALMFDRQKENPL